jgi:shikimate kinase
VNLEKVILVGPMGVGKSTLGVKVASALNCKYIDNDIDMATNSNKSVEELSQMSVSELHALEAEFILDVIAGNGPFVSGAAASVIENEEVQKALTEINSIYLSIPLEEIYKRTSAGTVGRQALNNDSDIIKERFMRRDPLYKKYARKTLILSDSVENDALRLLNLIKEN